LAQISKNERRVLVGIYVTTIRTDGSSFGNLARLLDDDKSHLQTILSGLTRKGLVSFAKGKYHITPSGRKHITVVMCGGAFDIIHPGHLETLQRSKSLGDVLVVSVARDITFERGKHKKPLHSEELRRELVQAQKPVDAAILGSKTDIFETVELLKPDIIAIGYDQTHSESVLAKEAAKRGVHVKVIRLTSSNPSFKSSKIIADRKDLLR
jgi:cytidyltransferase-like protein